MTKNVGTIDRIIRAAIGVVAVTVSINVGIGTVCGIVFIVVAAVALLTAVAGFCPLYRVLNVNTAKSDR